MSFIVLAVVSFLMALAVFSAVAFFFIRKKEWPASKKKTVFSLAVSFLCFPVLVPAGTVAVVPLPNLVLLCFGIADLDLLQIITWYYKTYAFVIPSYLITALLLRAVAAVVFYQHQEISDIQKQELG